MNRVAVRILHVEASPRTGPLERWLAEARADNAARLADVFGARGVDAVRIDAGPPDQRTFGERLRSLVAEVGAGAGTGLIYLGSGAIPLAHAADIEAFVRVADSGEARALVNNRYSADIVAVGQASLLADVPDLDGDNALPRWLEEVRGVAVDDRRGTWRLTMDLDSPLDVLLVDPAARGSAPSSIDAVIERLRAIQGVTADRRAELLVAGRTSATSLGWLERSTVSRVRALVEERGLRAAAPSAQAGGGVDGAGRRRPPRSILGIALDDRGPQAFGALVSELADGAFVDTRVLLAHRLGPDERAWPSAEDRFAADLLVPDRIIDPWLRTLTESAVSAPIPIVLGGHSLVGPGLRLAVRGRW